MREQQIDTAVKQMNKLYISYRKEYLKQNKDGYTWNRAKYINGKWQGRQLVDAFMVQHLKGEATYGVIAGPAGLTKFLTFDVDIAGNLNEAKEVTQKLFYLLTDYYGVSQDEVHISFSGNKGYHVDLFFDKEVDRRSLVPFYEEVLEKMKETTERIEMRPTGQGVKLPMGVNQKTGNYCYFVNPYTMEELEDSLAYFNQIQQTEWSEFKEFVLDDVVVLPEVKEEALTLEQGQAEEFDSLLNQLDLQGKSLDQINLDIVEVLQNGSLKYPNTRHRMSFLIPVFFNSQGADEATALKETMQVMLNTYTNYRDFIDKDTKRDKVVSEVERLVRITYEKGYMLNSSTKTVSISKKEILDILEVSNWKQKKLYLSMVIHSKRYAKEDGIFYMAYSTMSNMGNTTERGRLLKMVLSLENQKKVKVVSRAVVDVARTKAAGQVLHEANRYKVIGIEDDTSPTIELKVGSELALEEIIALLLTEDEAKKILPKSQFYNTGIREAFKKAA